MRMFRVPNFFCKSTFEEKLFNYFAFVDEGHENGFCALIFQT